MSSIILQGILFDEKSSYLRGSASAPPLIREQLYSDASNTFAENGVDIKTLAIDDKGDFSISSYEDIGRVTEEHLGEGNRLLTLGGDHSISFPVLEAFSQNYPNLSVLHIDAHADLYDEFEGDKHSHACPFARIMEGKLAKRLVQVGVRTLNQHQRVQAHKFGVELFEMRDHKLWEIPSFDTPVYISLDLDGIDPAFAPGVSHREPGGLSVREVLDIIQSIKAPIVGADIVEYNPERDIDGLTSVVAAKLMKEILSMMK